jgi:dTDP-3,4-didehydro-2,6-dideoxy-alpha-D-glucose 3-reductase
MKKLGIAVWGLGNHALNRIIPAINSVQELSLIGVCSRNENKVLESTENWDCHGWVDSSEMLSNSSIDVIYISTPIGIHFKQAIQALKAGKHVWCEKPLTCDYENTIELVKLAKEKRKMITEAFMFLYHPQFNKVQNFVKDKKTGHIFSVVCRFGIPKIKNPGFRIDPTLGGGALWDVASYTVAAVLALYSDLQVKVLFSEVCKKENSPVDSEGRAVLRFSNGSSAYLEWGIEVGYKNEIELWSDKGSFYTDKIFSKPENYQPIYLTRDIKGNESLDYGNISEQFKEMFYNFYNMFDSSELIKEEYDNILKRARVMDEIVRLSDLN